MGATIRGQPVGAWFVVAVAAIAAAWADLLVEALANHGTFGRASFTDGSNADVVPVVCLGTVFLLRFLYLRVRRALRAGTSRTPASRLHDLTPGAVIRLLPAVFAVQIAALWTMETIEQFVIVGHGFGGTIWLGGPTVLSLIVHAALCVTTAFGARSVLRALEPRAVRLIRALLAVLGTVDRERSVPAGRRVTPVFVQSCLVVCRIGERAPPAIVS